MAVSARGEAARLPGVALVTTGLRSVAPAVRARAQQTIADTLGEARQDMVKRHLSAPRTTRTRLARRSGALIRATTVSTRTIGGDILGRLFVSERAPAGRPGGARPYRYAYVHEFGATIRPKRRQYLAIPLNDLARAHRPRDFDLFVIRSRRGNLLLVARAGDGLLPMYVLKKRVRVPARPYMGPTAAKWLPVVLTRVQATVADELRTRSARAEIVVVVL